MLIRESSVMIISDGDGVFFLTNLEASFHLTTRYIHTMLLNTTNRQVKSLVIQPICECILVEVLKTATWRVFRLFWILTVVEIDYYMSI